MYSYFNTHIQAVKYYSQAAAILSQYEHVNSFDGIRDDCENTVKLLIDALRDTLGNPEITAAQVRLFRVSIAGPENRVKKSV